MESVFGMLIGLFTACDDEGKARFHFLQIFSTVSQENSGITSLPRCSELGMGFGDGNNSNEQNPVHVYEEGAVASLTAKDASGEVITKKSNWQVELTPWLAGDHTVEV